MSCKCYHHEQGDIDYHGDNENVDIDDENSVNVDNDFYYNFMMMVMIIIKYIETPCEALPARLSQLQTSIIICLSKKSTRFVEARSK